MALSVLGPVRLDGSTGPIPIPGRKARAIVTLLALAAPRPLSIGSICASLWDEPPPAAVKTVQGLLSRIRHGLAAADPPAGRLEGGSTGYRLVDPEGAPGSDVRVVGDLRRRARLAALDGDDVTAEQLLRAARELWRGEPELPHTIVGEAERARLAEEQLLLTEDHLAATLAVGASADAIAELDALTATHPLRERLWELRIQALYHCGRQTDALQAYRTVRRLLLDEVGVEPGPTLTALESAVLNHTVVTPHPSHGPGGQATPPVAVDLPHYTEAGGVHVAYAAFGDGPNDLLLLNPTFIPIDAYLEPPLVARAIARLARGRRVVAFDRRGLGLSDPVTPDSAPTIEQWVADAVSVLDADGRSRVPVLANADTSLIALMLAARHPERVASITLVNGYARFTSAPGYPYGKPEGELSEIMRGIHTPGETQPFDVVAWRLPSVSGDPRFRAWWDAVGRRGASPRTAALVHELIVGADLRDVLPLVQAPVLVLSRLGCASYDPGHGRYLAEHLPRATLRERGDPNDAWFAGDVDWVVEQLDTFAGVS